VRCAATCGAWCVVRGAWCVVCGVWSGAPAQIARSQQVLRERVTRERERSALWRPIGRSMVRADICVFGRCVAVAYCNHRPSIVVPLGGCCRNEYQCGRSIIRGGYGEN
jgi:hypothetical protein